MGHQNQSLLEHYIAKKGNKITEKNSTTKQKVLSAIQKNAGRHDPNHP